MRLHINKSGLRVGTSVRAFGLMAAFSLLPVLVLLIAATPYQQSEPRRLAGWGDLRVGQFLEIKAVRQDEGIIVASEIYMSGAKIEAPIQGIDVAESSLLILGVKVHVSAETKITDREDVPRDFSALRTGTVVVVKGLLRKDDTVDARQIILLKGELKRSVNLEGALQAIDPDRKKLRVLGINVLITDDSVMLFGDVEPEQLAGWDDLRIGQLLDIDLAAKHVRPDEDMPVASKIDVNVGRLEAPIQDIDVAENSLRILGVKVLATPETEITNPDEAPRDFSTLQTGSMVVVRGLFQKDGTVNARQIMLLEDKTKHRVILEGVLQAKDQDRKELKLLGATVLVTDDSQIKFD